METALPRLNLLRERADLVIFCFPNMMTFSDEEFVPEDGFRPNRDDWAITKYLEPDNPNALQWHRAISYNLWRLLAPDGICVRVEYATVNRDELSPPELQMVSFEEGSLDTRVGSRMPRQWFRVLASAYFRSRVLEDVYQQTEDERDQNGGYLITVLRAVGRRP